MSDQVVFTKEEVENIRKALNTYKCRLERIVCGMAWEVSDECLTLSNALSILDSPRPGPKIPMAMMYRLVNVKCDLEKEDAIDLLDDRIELTVSRFGFEVEDQEKEE